MIPADRGCTGIVPDDPSISSVHGGPSRSYIPRITDVPNHGL
jgi:hypothetical protein